MSDLFCKDCELLLKRSLLGLFLEGNFEFTVLGVGSSSEDEHCSSTFVDFGSRDQEAVTFLAASWDNFLDSIGLSSHGGFISDQIVAFNYNTIDRYDFTGFDKLDITDNEIVNRDMDDFTSFDDVDEFSLCYLVKFFELLFFDVVISGGDTDDNDDGDQDGGAFVPAVLNTLSGNTQDQ